MIVINALMSVFSVDFHRENRNSFVYSVRAIESVVLLRNAIDLSHRMNQNINLIKLGKMDNNSMEIIDN